MSTVTEAAPVAEETVDGQTSAVNDTPPADEKIAGEESLGDPGKKALDAMKSKWKAAEDRARAAEAAAAEALAKAEGKEKEYAAEQERRKVEKDALAKANERILKAEIRAQATAKLADPADALLYLDMSSFEVGDDGEVDAQAITDAIADLITKKPYLAAQGGPRFQGSADGGARKDAQGPSQLTRADLASMSPDQITQAKAEGRLNKLLGIK